MNLRLPASQHVDLLPLDDTEWTWKKFEYFCEQYVAAQPGVVSSNLYGKGGEGQKGIDIEAHLGGGRTRSYQCRRVQRFTKGDLDKTVKGNKYPADEHVVLTTAEVGVPVRDGVRALSDWSLQDRVDICAGLRRLDREQARRIVEDAFTVEWRRAFLGDGPIVFKAASAYYEPWLNETQTGLFHHRWPLLGRARDLQGLLGAITDPKIKVIVLVGRGGIGKTRLLVEVARSLDPEPMVIQDHVVVDARALEELPFGGPPLIVDDVHRRQDLPALLSITQASGEGRKPTKLILAMRPQGRQELEGLIALASLDLSQVWISRPLNELEQQSTEDLAVEALGSELSALAPKLAAATADCPLVTVIGGQLLAAAAINPALLERNQEFRQTVLDRFQDEMLGRLGPTVDAQSARAALVLLAALGPISMESEALLTTMGEELGLELHELRALIDALLLAGLIVAIGRFRRIVPDVLADHILHKACVDSQGDSLGRAEDLLKRYGGVSLRNLLRNLAELDWRLGRTANDLVLLDDFWRQQEERMASSDPEMRLEVIELIKPVAAWAPERALMLVRLALAHPAKTIKMEAFGYVADDARVREGLPPLIFTVAMGAGPQPEILRLLWELGRDQAGQLHSNPNHGVRMINDLCGYNHPLPFARAVLPVVRELVGRKEEMDGHLWSPLDLLPPLLAREGHTSSFRGLGFHIDPYFVSEAKTREVREEAQAILSEQALEATSRRNRVRAVQILGEGLRLPHSIAGHEPGSKVKEQWHDDQAAIVSALATIASGSDDAFVVAAALRAFDRHSHGTRWSDLVKQMNAVLGEERDRDVRLVGALGDPFDFRDEEAAQHKIDAMAKELVAQNFDGAALAELLETSLKSFAEQPEHGDRAHAQPARLVGAITRENTVIGRAIADWCVDHPESRLAAGAASILLSELGPEERERLSRSLMERGLEGRRLVAGRLAGGDWFADPRGYEADLLRQLAREIDPAISSTVLLTALRLAQSDPDLAVGVALEVDVDGAPSLVDDQLMAIHEHVELLDENKLKRLFENLNSVEELDFWALTVLDNLAAGGREDVDVVGFLISRAQTEDYRGPGANLRDFDLLGGADEEDLVVELARVRNALADAQGAARFNLQQLYWFLGEQHAGPGMRALVPCVMGDDDQAEGVIDLLINTPWEAILEHPEIVDELLSSAQQGSRTSDVRSALLDAAINTGIHQRSMGEPEPRFVRLRDEGQKLAGAFEPRTPAHAFYVEIAGVVDERIKEQRLEDEEAEGGLR